MKLKEDGKEFLEIVSRMEYNPSVDGLLLDKYPKLKRVPIFSKPPSFKSLGLTGGEAIYNNFSETDCDKLLRFVILFADSMSPYAEENDIEEKIIQCLNCLGLLGKNVIYREVMEQGDLFRAYLYEYFKKIHKTQYETWLALKLNLHNCAKVLMAPLSDDAEEKAINIRRQLSKDMSVLQKDLVDIEFKLFRDPRLLKLINESAMDNAIGGYAERNAESLEDWLKYEKSGS